MSRCVKCGDEHPLNGLFLCAECLRKELVGTPAFIISNDYVYDEKLKIKRT